MREATSDAMSSVFRESYLQKTKDAAVQCRIHAGKDIDLLIPCSAAAF